MASGRTLDVLVPILFLISVAVVSGDGTSFNAMMARTVANNGTACVDIVGRRLGRLKSMAALESGSTQ